MSLAITAGIRTRLFGPASLGGRGTNGSGGGGGGAPDEEAPLGGGTSSPIGGGPTPTGEGGDERTEKSAAPTTPEPQSIPSSLSDKCHPSMPKDAASASN
jgi:hypothetical protein